MHGNICLHILQMFTKKCHKREKFVMGDLMEIKRDYYLNQLIEKKENGLVIIITGIIRCEGTSTTQGLKL